MKKILIIILLLFSFFYTEKSIELVRNQDPIMKEIIKKKDKYEIKALNATIIENTITPGQNGKEVDLEKTYTKMKQYGTYNEALTILKETKPTISIEDNYDKYITRGNKENKNISFIFKVEKNININQLLNILNTHNITSTFFINKSLLDTNIVEQIYPNQIELISDNYDEITFSSSLSYLAYKTNISPKYCLSETNNDIVINTCKKLKLHTIRPTIIIEKDPYKELKNNLINSSIILIPINYYVYDSLTTSILYIKSKGYNFVTLSELLSESLEK